MRKLSVLCVLAVVLLAGCGGPSDKYLSTANFASDRFEEMTVLIRLGAFDQVELKQIKFWTDQAKKCLDDWHAHIVVDTNNANFDAVAAYQCVRASLINLLLYQEQAPPEMQKQALKE